MKERAYNIDEERFLRGVSETLQKSQALKKARKEKFNIFNILRKQHDEVYLHSAFLSNLLNPKGSHELDNKFLLAYLDRLGSDRIQLPANTKFTVDKEKVIGKNRLDILIRSDEHAIIIENKIYAIDQSEQLMRYKETIKNSLGVKDGQWLIVYLNLYGEEPSTYSLGIGKDGNQEVTSEEYVIQSYNEDIIEWLKECHQISSDHPGVRETIKQYINLLEKLTGKNLDHQTNKRIDELIRLNPKVALSSIRKLKELKGIEFERDEELGLKTLSESAERVYSRFKFVKKELSREVFNDLFKELKATVETSESWLFINQLNRKSYGGFKIRKKNWPNECYISVQGQPKLYQSEVLLGVQANEQMIDRSEITEVLKSAGLVIRRKSRAWPYFDRLIHFGNDDEITDYFHPNSFKKLVNEMKHEILDFMKKISKVDIEKVKSH